MPVIAPWIIPPNYPQIMESGARIGLSARQQDIAESEAGDRLRLAYSQLESQERRASEMLQERRMQNQAAMALRDIQARSLQAYREGQLAERSRSSNLREANMQRLAEQFATSQALKESQFGEREARLTAGQSALESRFRDREERLAEHFSARDAEAKAREERIRSLSMDPVSRAKLNATVADLRGTQREIEKIEAKGGPKTTWFGLGRGQVEAYEALTKKKNELESAIEEFKKDLGAGDALRAGATPAKANEVPRITKDGRRAIFDADSKKFLRYAD